MAEVHYNLYLRGNSLAQSAVRGRASVVRRESDEEWVGQTTLHIVFNNGHVGISFDVC